MSELNKFRTYQVADITGGGSLSDAISRIGSNDQELVLGPGTYVIDSDLTIPANVALVMKMGAILQVATGKTLTINGSFEAELYQVFDCVGTGVVKINLSEIFVDWFIDVTGDDNALGINKAVEATSAKGGVVKFSSKTYNNKTPIVLNGLLGVKLIGTGNGNIANGCSEISNNYSDMFWLSGNYITVKDLNLKTNGGHTFVQKGEVLACIFKNLTINQRCTGKSVYIHDQDLGNYIFNKWEDVVIYHVNSSPSGPTFYFSPLTSNGAANGNWWRNIMICGNRDYVWYFYSKRLNNYCHDNTIENILLEYPRGGAVKGLGCNNLKIYNLTVYDFSTTMTLTNDLFYFGSGTTANSKNIVLRDVMFLTEIVYIDTGKQIVYLESTVTNVILENLRNHTNSSLPVKYNNARVTEINCGYLTRDNETGLNRIYNDGDTFIYVNGQRIYPNETNESNLGTNYSASVSGIKVLHNSNFNFGTNSFSIEWDGQLRIILSTVNKILVQKSDGTNGWVLSVNALGSVQFTLNTTTYTTSAVLNQFTTYKIIVVVNRETSITDGSITIWINGSKAGVFTIEKTAPVSTDNSENIYIMGTSSALTTAGSCNYVVVYNLNLSDAQALSLYTFGFDASDLYAEPALTYTSNFGAGTDGWVGGASTVTGNVDNVSDGAITKNDCLLVEATGTSNVYCIKTLNAFVGLHGVSVGISDLYVYIPSTNITGVGVEFFMSGGNNILLPVTVGSWTLIPRKFVFQNENNLALIRLRTNTNDLSGITVGDKFYIASGFRIIKSGAVLALTPSGIQPSPGQWFDSSANKAHALQPISNTFVRSKNIGEIRWVNTWSGTHEEQYLGGTNQNILPSSNIRIESITMRCSATGVNVILGDGATTNRWVASVALATYLDCTVANRNHNGTNRKMVIDPDNNYTGSITTTVKYIILD